MLIFGRSCSTHLSTIHSSVLNIGYWCKRLKALLKLGLNLGLVDLWKWLWISALQKQNSKDYFFLNSFFYHDNISCFFVCFLFCCCCCCFLFCFCFVFVFFLSEALKHMSIITPHTCFIHTVFSREKGYRNPINLISHPKLTENFSQFLLDFFANQKLKPFSLAGSDSL